MCLIESFISRTVPPAYTRTVLPFLFVIIFVFLFLFQTIFKRSLFATHTSLSRSLSFRFSLSFHHFVYLYLSLSSILSASLYLLISLSLPWRYLLYTTQTPKWCVSLYTSSKDFLINESIPASWLLTQIKEAVKNPTNLKSFNLCFCHVYSVTSSVGIFDCHECCNDMGFLWIMHVNSLSNLIYACRNQALIIVLRTPQNEF